MRERIHMEAAKRTVGARIAVVIFVAVMVHSTLAESRQQQTPDSATATNMTKAEGSSGSSRREFYSLEVDGSTQWRDTGVDLRGGAKVQITAEGTITYAREINLARQESRGALRT